MMLQVLATQKIIVSLKISDELSKSSPRGVVKAKYKRTGLKVTGMWGKHYKQLFWLFLLAIVQGYGLEAGEVG